jgi:hypothetical protein
MKTAFVFLLTLLLVAPALANNTGADIYRKCKVVSKYQKSRASVTRIEILNAHYCMGMVNGMADVLRSFRKTELADVFGSCFPKAINTADLAKAIVSYSDRNPEILKFNEGTVVMSALMQTYPCR